jgi:hypothetical protein
MHNTLFFRSLAGGLAIACASSAGAAPISAAAFKRGGGHDIATRARAICRDVVEARRTDKVLSRIRNRPLSLSLVSAVTTMN